MREIFKAIIVAILTLEARMLLSRHRPYIIAITGSVGKTSTKDAIYMTHRPFTRARKSEKSFNSEIGVPLTVLGLPNAWGSPLGWIKNILDGFVAAVFSRSYPSVLILETGVDRPGDMRRLTKWLTPHMVVLTRLPHVPAHVEFFESPEGVIQEELSLIDALPTNGILVYNNDDELVRQSAEHAQQQTIGYGRYSETDVMATQDVVSYEGGVPTGMSFSLTYNDTTEPVTLEGCIGVPYTYTIGAAIATAVARDIPFTDAIAALTERFKPTPGRMRVLPGIKETTVIDDSYNSSPVAAERSLASLKSVQTSGRRIAVLGDMLELGRYSVRAHEEIGELVPECADVLITVGVRSRKTAEAALNHGLHERNIFQYDEVARAGRELQNMLRPGDVVLVKGSQSIRLEKLVKEIMAEPERAEELLVRHDAAWRER